HGSRTTSSGCSWPRVPSGRGRSKPCSRPAPPKRCAVPKSRSALTALAALAALACNPDDVVHRIGWFATMRQQRSIRPYARPIPSVPGTVPVTGAEPTMSLQTADRLVNPRTRTSESINHGRFLYETYCLVCHGTGGRGDGPISSAGGGQFFGARSFPARTFTLLGGVLAIAGGAVFLWLLAAGERARAWQSWHVNFMFWIGLAQGLVIVAATQKLAKGHWAGLMIRFAEAAVAFLFVALLLFAGEFVARAALFGWVHAPQRTEVGPWFTTPFFFVRTWLILALMAWLSWRFVRADMAPDIGELASGRPAERLEGRDAI